MDTQRILLIEDDEDILSLLSFNIEKLGAHFQVIRHPTGEGAFEKILETKPALIVLDVMLPRMYGTEILKLARADERTKSIPVIMLTARADEEDRIAGLEAGADDYVTKPFSPKELTLRIQGLLRRSNGGKTLANKENRIDIHGLSLYPSESKATYADAPINLTVTEFQLLLYLAENAGRLQNRDVLLQKVWGYEGNVNTRTVDTHVKRLRQKLGDAGAMIETVHGLGYRMRS